MSHVIDIASLPASRFSLLGHKAMANVRNVPRPMRGNHGYWSGRCAAGIPLRSRGDHAGRSLTECRHPARDECRDAVARAEGGGGRDHGPPQGAPRDGAGRRARRVTTGLDNLGSIHFARFNIINDDLHLISVYDGTLQGYVQEFAVQIGTTFDRILSFVADWPPPSCADDARPVSVRDHPAEFVEWVMAHDIVQLPRDPTELVRRALAVPSSGDIGAGPGDGASAGSGQQAHRWTHWSRCSRGSRTPTCRCTGATPVVPWARSATH